MAIPTDTVFEVQPGTGSDTQCGGGWSNANKGATGVDYSTNGTAKYTYTSDLSGSGTTTLTSAGSNFTNDILGNLIQISGQGIYCVTAFTNSATVTVDRNLGTFSSTTGYLGGSFNSIGQAGSVMVNGSGANCNGIYLKNTGTINTCSGSNNASAGRLTLPSGTTSAPAFIVGYTSSRTLNNTDAKPTVKPSANSVVCVNSGAGPNLVRNIAFTNPDSKTSCTAVQTADEGGVCQDCTVDAYATGIEQEYIKETVENCYVSNCTANGILLDSHYGRVTGCVVSGGTCTNGGIIANGSGNAISRCIVAGITNGNGISMAGPTSLISSVVYGCTSADGINVSGDGSYMENVISANNHLYNFDGTTVYSGITMRMNNCAGWTNTGSGDCNSNLTSFSLTRNGFITLTGNPFTNAAGGDFSLNTTTGAGAALRAAGWPASYPGISTNSYPDVGAAQHQDSPSSSIVLCPVRNNFYFNDTEP